MISPLTRVINELDELKLATRRYLRAEQAVNESKRTTQWTHSYVNSAESRRVARKEYTAARDELRKLLEI